MSAHNTTNAAQGWDREDLEKATDAVYAVNKPYLDDLAGTHDWLGNEQLQRAWARTQARAALIVVNGDMTDRDQAGE